MIHNCNQGKADDAMKEKSMVNEVTKGMADAAHAAVLQRPGSQQLTPLCYRDKRSQQLSPLTHKMRTGQQGTWGGAKR